MTKAVYRDTDREARRNGGTSPLPEVPMGGPEAKSEGDDLDFMAKKEARMTLQAALDAEMDDFLGRLRYERTETAPEPQIYSGQGSLARQTSLSLNPASLGLSGQLALKPSR
jgi:hypothetical protein